MDTLSLLTLQLAKALGVYILATGLAGLAAPARWKLMLEDYLRIPAITYLTAVVTLGVGLTLVMIHNLWSDPLAIIISLISWIVLVEGLVLMIVPEPFIKLGAALVGSTALTRAWAVFALIAGAALLIAGLTGHASVS